MNTIKINPNFTLILIKFYAKYTYYRPNLSCNINLYMLLYYKFESNTVPNKLTKRGSENGKYYIKNK